MCKLKLDVGIIMDSSGSLKQHYDDEKAFLKVLMAHFGLSERGTRAGVIIFAHEAGLVIKLGDHNSSTSFNGAVDKIPLIGTYSRIDKALRLSQKELFAKENGARQGVPKVLILLTDGIQTEEIGYEIPDLVAKEIRGAGVKLLVVGIGHGANKAQLMKLAGGKREDVFHASTFKELTTTSFIDAIVRRSCTPGEK